MHAADLRSSLRLEGMYSIGDYESGDSCDEFGWRLVERNTSGKDVEARVKQEFIENSDTESSGSENEDDAADATGRELPSENRTLLPGLDRSRYEIDFRPGILYCEDIGSEDEVCVVQCPQTVDPKALLNRRVAMEASTVLDELLEVVARSSKTSRPFVGLLPSRVHRGAFQAVPMQPSRWLTILERVPVVPKTEPQLHSKRLVAFPSKLKKRHPLLGAGFQAAVEDRSKRHYMTETPAAGQGRKSKGSKRGGIEGHAAGTDEPAAVGSIHVGKHLKHKRKDKEMADETAVHIAEIRKGKREVDELTSNLEEDVPATKREKKNKKHKKNREKYE